MFDIDCLKLFSKKPAILWYEKCDQTKLFKYSDLIDSSILITNCVLRQFAKFNETDGNENTRYVGVALGHSPPIIPVIIGIINSSAAFCCINPDNSFTDTITAAKQFECNLLICETGTVESNDDLIILEEIIILNKKLVVLAFHKKHIKKLCSTIADKETDLLNSSQIMFCACTSGSTGTPKVIEIPFKCFMPNVFSLGNLFGVTTSDRILVSAPPTFDPFVLDICLALCYGATIIMLSPELRLSAQMIAPILFQPPNGVTIMQITPSLFHRWSNLEIQNYIMNEQSSLRILIFGGEAIPNIHKMMEWQNWAMPNRKRIFNIYGITEMSCWATIYEITSNDVFQNNSIPIGRTIDSFTQLEIIDCTTNSRIESDNGIGELCLKSTIRRCIIDKTDANKNPIKTGDIVELKDNHIYFKSRKDDIIKRFGNKVNLKRIEKIAKTSTNIIDACCVFQESTHSLHLFIKSNEFASEQCIIKERMLKILMDKLPEHELPNSIIILEQFPLSHHGKISKPKLLKLTSKQCDIKMKPEQYLLFIINSALHTNLCPTNAINRADCSKRIKTEWNSSFRSLGGSSFLALNLTTDLQNKYYKCSFPSLLMQLLDEQLTIFDVFSYVQNQLNLDEQVNDSSMVDEPKQIAKLISLWTINFDKCVDSSPTICHLPNGKVIVSVGSHSNILINANLMDGKILSKINLPDRIECQVTQYEDNNGLVGCYNGRLYCFEIASGSIQWSFDSGGMIKSKSLLIDHLIYFGNYNLERNLFCLNAKNGTLCWSTKIGSKSIYANICQFGLKNRILVCTLDGLCACVNAANGLTEWKRQLKSPIFSNPKMIPNKKMVLLAEVSGLVHCIDFEGNLLWNYLAAGNIYSSFEIIEKETTTLIIFGCHDSSVYCLSVEEPINNCTLLWQSKTDAQLFSTPKLLDDVKFSTVGNVKKCVLCCCTNGMVYLLQTDNGSIRRQYKIDGEIFSSPAVWNNNIFVGCRNNNLICFQVH